MPTFFVDSASFNNITINNSLDVTSNIFVTGTFSTTAGVTGSVFGTASFTQQAISSSYITASNIYGPYGASSVISSSYSLTTLFSNKTESYYVNVGARTDTIVSTLSGSGVKFSNQSAGIHGTGAVTPISPGVLYIMAIYIPASTTITGTRFFTNNTPVFVTSSNYNGIGLYSYDGAGTINIVASSSNDPLIWSTANSAIEKNFPTSIQLSSGVYFIGALYNRTSQTTAPSLTLAGASSNIGLITMDFTNSGELYGTLSNNYTSLPISIALSTATATTARTYVGLY